MNFKAVIFDLDGTLLDTLADIANSMNRVLEKFDFPTFDVDAYKKFVGNGTRTLVTRAIPEEAHNDKFITGCVEDFRKIYSQNFNVSTKPYEGIPDLLNKLVKQGIKLSIFSNKYDDFTKECVFEFLPEWKFEVIRGRFEGIPLKPDPTGALQIAETMGINPSDTIFVGDSGVDMQTAVAAGMFPVGALWGFREKKELEDEGAKILLERPQDLLTLVGMNNT